MVAAALSFTRETPHLLHTFYIHHSNYVMRTARRGARQNISPATTWLMIAAVTITTAGQFVHLQQHGDGH